MKPRQMRIQMAVIAVGACLGSRIAGHGASSVVPPPTLVTVLTQKVPPVARGGIPICGVALGENQRDQQGA